MEGERLKQSWRASGMMGPVLADLNSHELLSAIALRPANANNQRIYRLAAEVRDWDSLLDLAQEHRMLPMLFRRLSEIGDAVPPAARERLQGEYHSNVFHSLANAAELIDVLKAFDREAIPAIPFKGVVLAASIYHDLAIRPAGDLDLLIHSRHLARATAILLERGYDLTRPVGTDGTPAYPDEYEYHFERKTDGMVMELCWRLDLFQRRLRRNLDLDWVWPERRTTTLAGAEVPDMSPEIKLLVLCMHGSKHIWSRLVWICDVAQLLDSSPDLDWKAVVRKARQSGLWRSLALGVMLGHRIAGAPVPPSVLRRLESDKTACRLVQHIQENLFDAAATTPVGRVPYTILLLGFHDRMRLLLSWHLLRPNERDRTFLPLPKSLHAVYYLIRPFRILLDKSAR